MAALSVAWTAIDATEADASSSTAANLARRTWRVSGVEGELTRIDTRSDRQRGADASLAVATAALDNVANALGSVPLVPLDHYGDSDGFPAPIDMADSSASNVAAVHARASAGDLLALSAFLTLAAHEADFTQRSHDLLLVNAARGSVLALTELAARAEVGYGFPVASRTTALFFENLAWRTGRWNPPAGAASGFGSSLLATPTSAELHDAEVAGAAAAAYLPWAWRGAEPRAGSQSASARSQAGRIAPLSP